MSRQRSESSIPQMVEEEFKIRVADSDLLEVTGKRPNRKLILTKFVKANSVILTEDPLIFALDVKYWNKLCQHCFAVLPKRRLSCLTCQRVFYCSSECADSHSTYHNNECKFITAMSSPDKSVSPPEIMRDFLVFIRFLVLSGGFANCLCYHDRLPRSITNHLHLITKFAKISDKECKRNISRVISNAFTITTPISEFSGLGVYLCSAMANHSCVPNTAIQWHIEAKQAPKLQLITLVDLQPGTELVHSYVGLELPRAHRRHYLSEMYNINCKCGRCMNPPAVDLNFERFTFDPTITTLDEFELDLAGRPHYDVREYHKTQFCDFLANNKTAQAIDCLRKMMQFDLIVFPHLHPQITFLHFTYKSLLDALKNHQGDLRKFLEVDLQSCMPAPTLRL